MSFLMPPPPNFQTTASYHRGGTIAFQDPGRESVNEKYTMLQKLGEGSYATVYKALVKGTGKYVALKEHYLDAEAGLMHSSICEISTLKELIDHPNIVKLYDIISSECLLTLVFEYCPYDLHKFMKQSATRMDPWTVRDFMKQFLEGLAYCHAKKLIHRDLKPQNILITDGKPGQHILKIADFGLAKSIGYEGIKSSVNVVTLWYKAPDVILGSKSYGTSIDMWSCGCIFAEMMYEGKPLFRVADESSLLEHILTLLGTPSRNQIQKMKSEIPELNTSHPVLLRRSYEGIKLQKIIPGQSPAAIHLLQQMLMFDPAERISAAQALQHPYFTGSDNRPSSSAVSRPELTTRPRYQQPKHIDSLSRQRA